jgi:hypothetical protein
MTQQTGVPAGWYPDPANGATTRWWDGRAWTAHTAQTTRPPGYSDYHAGYEAGRHQGSGVTRDRGLEWVLPVGRTGLSIAAGYVGLVAVLCFYVAPVALVVGLLALRGLRDSPLGGRGRAWFAVIVGGLGTIGLAVAGTVALTR